MKNDIMPPTTDDSMEMDDMRSKPADKWMIESIDGRHATATNGEKRVTLPLDFLPKGTQEGDMLDDEQGAFLHNDPTGDMNMREQEDMDMPMGRSHAEPDDDQMGGPSDVDADNARPMKLMPKQRMAKLRM